MHDFVKSLAKIREKKPEIYNPTTQFFSNEYKETTQTVKKDKKTGLFYKDMVREELLNEKPNRMAERIREEETPVEEQIRLKQEFQMASNFSKENENLFSIKTKSQKEIENENVMFDKFLIEEARKNKPDEVAMLKRFWGDDAKLDDSDKFLRKYIMTKGFIFINISFLNIYFYWINFYIDGLMKIWLMMIMMWTKRMMKEMRR